MAYLRPFLAGGALMVLLGVAVSAHAGTVERMPRVISIFPKQQPEVIAFFAIPSTITAGERTMLAWKSVGADNCELRHVAGSRSMHAESVPTEGTQFVSPAETTTYEMRCAKTLHRGVVSDSAFLTVTVEPVPILMPLCELTVDGFPNEITVSSGPDGEPGYGQLVVWEGTRLEIEWDTAYTTNVVDPTGDDDRGGIWELEATEDATYSMTVTGTGGTTSCTVDVDIISID